MDGGNGLNEVVFLRKLVGEINYVFQAALAATNDFLLRYFFIFDSGFLSTYFTILGVLTTSEGHREAIMLYMEVVLSLYRDTVSRLPNNQSINNPSVLILIDY